jgi:WD40 repeat protein
VGSLRFIHEGRTLVSLGYEGSIKFWDTESWAEARTVDPKAPGLRGLIFSPDERTVALSMESKVQLWSLEPWRLEAELPISTKVVSGMAFAPAGRWLAIGGADKKIRMWQLE